MNRKSNIFAIWVIIGLVLLFFLMYQSPVMSVKLHYSDFKELLKSGVIENVVLGSEEIEVKLKEGANIEGTALPADIKEKIRKNNIRLIKVDALPVDDKSLIEELEKNGISYRGKKTDQIIPLLFSWILPIALIVGFWIFLMRRAQKSQGGAFAFGKSKVRIYRENDVKTTFKDVAGVDEAKEELQEIVEYLRSPQKYVHIGARIPKGVLLVGPPGTGKTLLARAVAGEAKVAFFSISGPEFVEMFVGVGAARVRDLFEQALKSAPCIIFIDELDALGKARGVGISGGNEEREQTLNQLLVEMDGFETNKGVVIMAATNRPEILDPALLRPGRFDRQVLVDRPDMRGREEILKVHVKGVRLGPDVDIAKIAQRTPGFVGADLANLVNEAALLAARKNQKDVTMANFDEAVERVIAGLEKKNRIITEKERKIIAYHEAGHALVAESLPNQDRVQKISIVPRGLSALGYTIQLPTEDRYLMTRSELADKLCVLLGGLSAETITMKEISTGASNDLSRATEIARSMVTQYGMSEEIGPVAFKKYGSTFLSHDGYTVKEYGDTIADKIDAEVRKLIEVAKTRAENILSEKMELLTKVAEALLEKEYIEGEELAALLRGKQEQGASAPS